MAFEQGLILATLLAAFALVQLLRRFDLTQRFYVMVVGSAVTLGLLALVRADRFLGVLAMGLTAASVVLPAVLETVARAAFGRGYMRLAVRVAGLRALLMPGAGLERQQEILRGLALLESKGVDAALEHFHDLAGDTEDGGELAIIHEQIVAMLFYGQRWNDGIAHYEGQFHPGYAAVRPALALGLLRAYGESGRLDTAAGLLRALEEGPIGADPRAIGVLSQARVTFLAYVGDDRTVRGALAVEHLETLGISRANGALLRGIAAARAGDLERATVELRSVAGLAAGPADNRAVEASSALLVEGTSRSGDLPPELHAYVAAVAGRLQRFLLGTPSLHRYGPLLSTPLLIGSQVLGYVVALWATSYSTLGLLEVGALTPELWQAGSWARVATAPFLHGDAIGLVLAAYAVWLGGPVIERLRGSAVLGVTALASGAVGSWAAVALGAPATAVVAGGNLLAFGVAFGALFQLIPRFSPGLVRSSRRTLAIPVALVLVANVVAAVPAFLSLDVLPVGLAAAAVTAMVVLVALPQRPRATAQHLLLAAIGAMLLLVGVSAGRVAREDVGRFLEEHRDRRVVLHGVAFQVPAHVSEVDAGQFPAVRVPVYAGLADRLAARAGTLAQLLVVPGTDDGATTPALFRMDPGLAHQTSLVERGLPRGVAETPGGRGHTLRRNGEAVAAVFERTVGGSTVLLLVAPPPPEDAGDAGTRLLMSIWAAAAPASPQ